MLGFEVKPVFDGWYFKRDGGGTVWPGRPLEKQVGTQKRLHLEGWITRGNERRGLAKQYKMAKKYEATARLRPRFLAAQAYVDHLECRIQVGHYWCALHLMIQRKTAKEHHAQPDRGLVESHHSTLRRRRP